MSPDQNPTRSNLARGRPPRPTTARGPRSGLLLSLALHVGLIGATYLTWHRMLAPSDIGHAVPVELITVAAQTNVAPQAPPPEKIETPKPDLEPPALPQFALAEPAPEPPLPKIKIKPQTTDEADETAKKPSAKDFAALLNKLTATPPPVKDAKTAPRTVQGVGAANLATASLVDALRSQIARCWSPPVGAPNAGDLVVDFDLKLNRNGTVAELKLSPGSVDRASSNPYTRAASEAASRAIYECQGAGYRLPPERYEQWSEISPLRFDPRQMMNQ